MANTGLNQLILHSLALVAAYRAFTFSSQLSYFGGSLQEYKNDNREKWAGKIAHN